MKTLQLEGEKYDLCETAEDLSIKRFTHLKEYLMYKQTGVAIPNLVTTLQEFIQGYDNESKSQMLITLYNFMTGLNQVESKVDADQMIFAIMTFEKGENKQEFNEGKALEKLEKMNSQGLTQKKVEEEVESFINASSAHFISSLKASLMGQMENPSD